jgi:type III secretion protein D
MIVIGSDESADVVLLDPGIESSHARLRQTSEGWAISSLDGDVLSSETNEALKSLDLEEGEFARIGRVWISVVDSDALWGEPPPDPVDIESDDLNGDNDGSEETQPDEDEQRKPAAADDAPAGAPQDESSDQVPDGDTPQAGGKRKLSTSVRILGMIGIIIMVAAWSASQLVGGSAEAVPLKPGISAQSKGAGAGPAGSPSDAILSQDELRAAFRKRLAEVDLLKSFDLNLQDHSWTMQGALDDEEAARFERTLATFIAQHKITFPVTAKVGNAEHMLPFKIRQVISGANASVVTLDGNRLYVGDEYKGTRLVAIKGSKLTFVGKRKIEVRW